VVRKERESDHTCKVHMCDVRFIIDAAEPSGLPPPLLCSFPQCQGTILQEVRSELPLSKSRATCVRPCMTSGRDNCQIAKALTHSIRHLYIRSSSHERQGSFWSYHLDMYGHVGSIHNFSQLITKCKVRSATPEDFCGIW